jgi:hypothetical protein
LGNLGYDAAWFTSTIAGILLIALPLMLAVAMIIYADRKIMGRICPSQGTECGWALWAVLQSFADGLKVFLQETIIPERVEPRPVPDRADHHLHRGFDGMGGHPVCRWGGAVEHQCRFALCSGDQQPWRLWRDHCGLGFELEISVLFRHAGCGANDIL